MRIIRAADENGCVLACMAMITGYSYKEVKEQFARAWCEHCGLREEEWIAFLSNNGYSLIWFNRWDPSNRFERPLWPVGPVCEVNLSAVKVTQNSRINHLVVVLIDGTVIDPQDSSKKHLSDYYEVYNIVGVCKC